MSGTRPKSLCVQFQGNWFISAVETALHPDGQTDYQVVMSQVKTETFAWSKIEYYNYSPTV